MVPHPEVFLMRIWKKNWFRHKNELYKKKRKKIFCQAIAYFWRPSFARPVIFIVNNVFF